MLSCRHKETAGTSLAVYRLPNDWKCQHSLHRCTTDDAISKTQPNLCQYFLVWHAGRPALILEAVAILAVLAITMVVLCSFAQFRISQNITFSSTKCISEAQNVPKLYSALDPAGIVSNATPNPVVG